MAVTQDILRTWRHPRLVMRGLLADVPSEARALAFLIVGCILVFVSQWPRLAREAAGFELPAGTEAPDLTAALTHALYAWVILAPLMFYAIAAVSHLIAKVVGGKGTFYTARVALFWSLLATAPMLLLYGLLAGFQGPVASTQLVGGIWLAGFVIIWVLSLIEAEQSA